MIAAIEVAFDVAAVIGAVAAVIGAIGAVAMRKESKPNSGSTFRDAIDRIERAAASAQKSAAAAEKASTSSDLRLSRIELTLEDHTRRLDAGGSTMTRLSDRIDHLTDRTPT
jgi:septal ring factor EnvC (AmiA/AmiB activator)